MPPLSRRGFLGGVGVLAAVSVPAWTGEAPATAPTVRYRGHDLYWSGWQVIPNQVLAVGYWVARVPPDAEGRDQVVATTLGRVMRSADAYVIDLRREDGWAWVQPWTPAATRHAIKHRAYQALCEALDAAA